MSSRLSGGGAWFSSSLSNVGDTLDVALWLEVARFVWKSSSNPVASSGVMDGGGLPRGASGLGQAAVRYTLGTTNRPGVTLVGQETRRKFAEKTCKSMNLVNSYHRWLGQWLSPGVISSDEGVAGLWRWSSSSALPD